jgi:hypothetical protein
MAEQRRAAAAEAQLQEERARSARLQAILEQHGIPPDQ